MLQALLAKYPDLLAGDQLAGSPRRWLLVKREARVPDREVGGKSSYGPTATRRGRETCLDTLYEN